MLLKYKGVNNDNNNNKNNNKISFLNKKEGGKD